MVADRRTQLMLIRKGEQVNKVLEMLNQNRDGLKANQIGLLSGMRLQRTILLDLKNEGKIRLRKGLSQEGRITLFYVLNEKGLDHNRVYEAE